MIMIIHGGHRKGLCYEAAKTFEQLLQEKSVQVKFCNLRDNHFNFCCGDQPCQDSGVCIYSDVMTDDVIPTIANCDALIIFTPTYFNMPPAILKNFIDRCNLLLTIKDRKHPKFGAWISGQTEENEGSVEACYNSLVTFAEICEMNINDALKIIRFETTPDYTKITQDDIRCIEQLVFEILS